MRRLCPITAEADMPLVKGAVNSRTLLLKASVTQRSPDESKATAVGSLSWEAETPAP